MKAVQIGIPQKVVDHIRILHNVKPQILQHNSVNAKILQRRGKIVIFKPYMAEGQQLMDTDLRTSIQGTVWSNCNSPRSGV